MAKNVYTEQVQMRSEKTHRPGLRYSQPHFIAAGTSSTRPATLRQFAIPGTIDPHYSQPFPERKTEPEVRATPGAFLKTAGTGSTRPATLRQFAIPGTIGPHYSQPFPERKTEPEVRATPGAFLKTAGTGSTRPATLRQFAIPGTIGPHYSQPFSERKTEPEVRAIPGAFIDLQATRKMANPPYDRNAPTPANTIHQYLMLLQVLLAEYRTTWFFHVFGGILIPIGFAFIIIAVGGATSSEKAIYLLGGNMALSIVTGPASFIISKIGSARQTKAFHYWIALPIPKLTLILAIASVAQLFALPGLLGTYVLGSLLLGLPFTDTSWILPPLALLGSVSLTGLGALLGSIVRDSETANVLSSISIIFVSFLSPVILPLDALPVPLRITALVMPTTYVADAFRAALGGHQGTNMAFDLIILTLFSAVSLIFTYFRLDWRDK